MSDLTETCKIHTKNFILSDVFAYIACENCFDNNTGYNNSQVFSGKTVHGTLIFVAFQFSQRISFESDIFKLQTTKLS